MPIRLRNSVEQVVCVLEVTESGQSAEGYELADRDGVATEAVDDCLGVESFELGHRGAFFECW